MKLLLSVLVALLLVANGVAQASSEQHLEKAHIDSSNMVSLQNGAKLYINYCLGCHSLKYQRYQRMADDLQIPQEILMQNLMFTSNKVGDSMSINMPAIDAAKWFGTTPPDLSLMARAKGIDYLYAYLKGFYKDSNRPYGVNNLAFKDVGMPHVLEPLQGLFAKGEDGSLVRLTEGQLNQEEYDHAVLDLVNFLDYVSEPIKTKRIALGIKVMFFLFLFLALTYFLKKEYWRDVH